MFFQVVALDDPGNAAEVLIGIHRGCGSGFLIHGEERFHIAVTVVRQDCHELIGLDDLTGVRVNGSGSIAVLAHLHGFT